MPKQNPVRNNVANDHQDSAITLPWEIVPTNVFKFRNDEYLSICDNYSGFFDIEYIFF